MSTLKLYLEAFVGLLGLIHPFEKEIHFTLFVGLFCGLFYISDSSGLEQYSFIRYIISETMKYYDVVLGYFQTKIPQLFIHPFFTPMNG